MPVKYKGQIQMLMVLKIGKPSYMGWLHVLLALPAMCDGSTFTKVELR